MKDEKTIYDEQPTVAATCRTEETVAADSDATVAAPYGRRLGDGIETKGKKRLVPRVAAGLGVGALAGSAAMLFTSSARMKELDSLDHEKEQEDVTPQVAEDGTERENGDDVVQEDNAVEMPTWVDPEVPVARNVTDDMSFSEAFNAARAEVGSGGAFEWRGQVFGTYTEEEWNDLTASERASFGRHFHWDEYQASKQDDTVSDDIPVVADDTSDSDDEVEVVAIDDEEDYAEIEILGTDDSDYINLDGDDTPVLVDIDGDVSVDIDGMDLGIDQGDANGWMDMDGGELL